MGVCVLNLSKVESVSWCIFITLLYVGSFYLKRERDGNYRYKRDLPETIKYRFLCIGIISIIAPMCLLLLCSTSVEDDAEVTKATFLEVIGIRRAGFVAAIFYPLFLTTLLFLGPLFQKHEEITSLVKNPEFSEKVTDLLWWRTFIVGPLSEEFVFRACFLPLLVPAFGTTLSIFIAPTLFGLAHLHHIYTLVNTGFSLTDAVATCAFQFCYTTLFGVYSSFLFLQTKHLISVVCVHSFCNAMGFPDVSDILESSQPRKNILILLYISGFLLWLSLMPTLTLPDLFVNNL